MMQDSSHNFAWLSKLLLKCVIAFGIGLTIAVTFLRARERYRVYSSQPFDFTYGVSEDEPWKGPKVGSRLDIKSLVGQDGRALSDEMQGKIAMLILVDPGCGACRASSDQMRKVRDEISRERVPYFVVTFSSTISPDQFATYAASLGLNEPFFLRLHKDQPLAPELLGLVLPTHLLIDAEGTILRRWPGTSKTGLVREIMADRIVSDTLLALKNR
jgi:hypothetical protein